MQDVVALLAPVNDEQLASGEVTQSEITKRMKWLRTVAKTLLDGIGASTQNRQCSSEWLVKDPFVLKCTLFDPRFKDFSWREGDTLLPQLAAGQVLKLVEELRDEAVTTGTTQFR